jgi:hypothetical protein
MRLIRRHPLAFCRFMGAVDFARMRENDGLSDMPLLQHIDPGDFPKDRCEVLSDHLPCRPEDGRLGRSHPSRPPE